jgi:transporter family protein
MLTYGVSTFLLKVVFRSIHPAFGLAFANVFVVSAGVGWMMLTGAPALRNVGWNGATGLLLVASTVLAVAIVSFYKALSLGPASVVAPIFALSFIVAAVLGLVLLGEPVKATRIAGLILGVVAISLLTR